MTNFRKLSKKFTTFAIYHDGVIQLVPIYVSQTQETNVQIPLAIDQMAEI